MIKYSRQHTLISDIDINLENKEILFIGWIRSVRLQAKIGFIVLYDGTTSNTIQAITESSEIIESLRNVTSQSFIKLNAQIVKHPKKANIFDLKIINILKISKINDPITYPLSGTPSLQLLRDHQSIRGHSEIIGAVKRITSSCSYYVSDFMRSHKVKKVFPPTITCSDCEGAGETFTVTKLLNKSKSLPTKQDNSDEIDYSQDFFGVQASLTVSAQLHLESCLRGLGDVWCELPSYRAEPSDTSRHVAAFTHQEAEFMGMNLDGLMDVLEELTQYCFSKTLIDHIDDLKLIEKYTDKKDLIEKLKGFVSKPYQRISYDKAIEILLLDEHKKKLKAIPKWGDDLGSDCEKYLSEIIFKHPTIVYDYPTELKSFYMKQNDDNRTVQSCDLLIPGLGELCGASVREDNYGKLINIVNKRKMDIKPIQWYIDLRKEGSVETAGFGMGFERLICCITGMHIREVCSFVQAYKCLKY
uniref:asparagine--tRNA ligase n=1 Tax=viral metagenome TaxID=1070528 RepID=A0A6C0H083_9ZZZZ